MTLVKCCEIFLMKDAVLASSLFLFLMFEIESAQETVECSEEMSRFDICTFTDLFMAVR